MSTSTPPVLEQDIPCIGCGYDLRGLSETSVCPECGFAIESSIARWDQSNRIPLLASEPKWLARIREGLWITLAAFVLMVALAWAPDWMFQWRSPQRRWMLYAACTTFALAGWGIWIVTTPDRGQFARRDRFRRTLRMSAMLYFASPFLLAEMPRNDPPIPWTIFAVVVLVAGLVASLAYFVYLRRLAVAARLRVIPIQATLLTAGNVLLFLVTLLPGLDTPEDSLSNLFRSHLVSLGAVEWLYDVRVEIANHYFPHPFLLAGAAIPVWSAAITLRMILRLKHLSRQIVGGGK